MFNIPPLVTSIWNERESATKTKSITIGKVPQILRKVESNEACFNPEVLSLGPYHVGNSRLKGFDRYKHMAMWNYTNSNYYIENTEPFYEALREVITEVRNCYEKEFEYSNEEFAWLMLIDGCFVLEFIINKDLSLREHDKSIVVRDMMLLENQLPFLVLKTLTVTKEEVKKGKRPVPRSIQGYGADMMSHTIPSIQGYGAAMMSHTIPFPETTTKIKDANRSVGPVGDLLKIINHFTDLLTETPAYPWLSSGKKDELKSSGRGRDVNEEAGKTRDNEGNGKDIEPAHLLDSFRTKLLGKTQVVNKQSAGNSWYSFRSASELKAAGIKFRRSETTKPSDVKFESHFFSAELFLPPIIVDDYTKPKLLNMIAYELCPYGPRDYGISFYMCLLDSLIDSEEDVKELRPQGIILNALGSDQDLPQMFNVLATDLPLDYQAYAEVKRGIESHCKRRWNVYMANLYYTHFNTPWAVLATIAAIFLLTLTVIQTYFAIYPSSN